jgi:hypothetical protein
MRLTVRRSRIFRGAFAHPCRRLLAEPRLITVAEARAGFGMSAAVATWEYPGVVAGARFPAGPAAVDGL